MAYENEKGYRVNIVVHQKIKVYKRQRRGPYMGLLGLLKASVFRTADKR